MYGKPALIATSRILDPMGSTEREGGQGGTSAWNWHRESDTVTSIRRSTEDAGTRLQGAMELGNKRRGRKLLSAWGGFEVLHRELQICS
ncbi:unnamed protein product [Caretta caretta]